MEYAVRVRVLSFQLKSVKENSAGRVVALSSFKSPLKRDLSAGIGLMN